MVQAEFQLGFYLIQQYWPKEVFLVLAVIVVGFQGVLEVIQLTDLVA